MSTPRPAAEDAAPDASARPAGAAVAPAPDKNTHPVARRNLRVLLAGVILFNVFAGTFWRHALGWWGWGIVIGLTLAAAAAWAITRRDRIDLRRLPLPLVLFGLWILASTAWSAYPLETLLGVGVWTATIVGALPLAFLLDWRELARALAGAMKAIVGLSLVFELYVSLIVQGPLAGNWFGQGVEETPVMELWSRDLLFAGGKIQGILGNSIPLNFCALLLIVLVVLRLADRRARLVPGILWIALGVLTVWLTQSSTLLLATIAAAGVAGLALLRRRIGRNRVAAWALRLVTVGGVAGVIAFVLLAPAKILELLGKSSDLTGRLEIWQVVIGLAEQRPAVGWGWVGYWPTWVPMFDDLYVRWGTTQIHSHNAWLDLWMQVGLVGVAIFACLVVSTVGRSWFAAVDQPWLGPVARAPYRALSLLPLVILVILVLQTAAESRILIEEGLLLFAVLAIKVKARPYEDELARESAEEDAAGSRAAAA